MAENEKRLTRSSSNKKNFKVADKQYEAKTTTKNDSCIENRDSLEKPCVTGHSLSGERPTTEKSSIVSNAKEESNLNAQSNKESRKAATSEKVISTRKKRPSSEDEQKKDISKLPRGDSVNESAVNTMIIPIKQKVNGINPDERHSSFVIPQTSKRKKACVKEDKQRINNSKQRENATSTRKKRPSAEDKSEKEIKVSKSSQETKLSLTLNKRPDRVKIEAFDDNGHQSNTINDRPKETLVTKANSKTVQKASASGQSRRGQGSYWSLFVRPPASYFSKSFESDTNKYTELDIEKSKMSNPTSNLFTNNICHHHFNTMIRNSSHHRNSQAVTYKLANYLSHYEVVDNDHPFQCRVTSLEWHPRRQNFLGVGSKHGDMVFYKIQRENYSRMKVVQKFRGIGPGGNIASMKFHPTNDDQLYATSLVGQVLLYDLERRSSEILLDTMSHELWYPALDVHKTEHLVCAGKNKGHASMMDRNGIRSWEKRLHGQKITHLEFSPQDPFTFITASLDHTVRLWDVRKVVDKDPMELLFHNHAVNSATFSSTDGGRLLTTDQKDEIRVFKAPSWKCETLIRHPHRFFQHITPIKATWHPEMDIILIGRYPDTLNLPQYDNLRSIDLFDASSGELLGSMRDNHYDGIISLTSSNHDSTKVAAAMGYNINLWNHEAPYSTDELSLNGMDAFHLSRNRVTQRGRQNGRDSRTGRLKNKKTLSYVEPRHSKDHEYLRELNGQRDAAPQRRTEQSDQHAAEQSIKDMFVQLFKFDKLKR